jgi:hypothetical protein
MLAAGVLYTLQNPYYKKYKFCSCAHFQYTFHLDFAQKKGKKCKLGFWHLMLQIKKCQNRKSKNLSWGRVLRWPIYVCICQPRLWTIWFLFSRKCKVNWKIICYRNPELGINGDNLTNRQRLFRSTLSVIGFQVAIGASLSLYRLNILGFWPWQKFLIVLHRHRGGRARNINAW